MRNSKWSKQVSVAGRILLAFLFVFSQSAWAGQDPKAKDNPKPAQKAAAQQTAEKPSSAATTAKTDVEEEQAEAAGKPSAEEKPYGGGNHEGIKVHGHWTIDVRNPDGTLVTHREFENSLVPTNGNAVLLSLLARSSVAGGFQVGLSNPSGTGLCGAGVCTISESSQSFSQGNSSNLVVQASIFGNSNVVNQVNLIGSVFVISGGSIVSVNTVLFTCPASVSPQACASGSSALGSTFTQTTISPQPISVAPRQIVQVTVNLSFS
jgi:hypothetical protein